MSEKTFDLLNAVVRVVLPAFATMVLGIGQVLEWDGTDKLVAIIVIVTTFLGVLVQVLSMRWKANDDNLDGFLEITGLDEDTGRPNLGMTLNKLPEELNQKKVVRLRPRQRAA